MTPRLGPILALQDATLEQWTISILISYEGQNSPPDIEYKDDNNAGLKMLPADQQETIDQSGKPRVVARYMLDIDLHDDERTITYWVAGTEHEAWRVRVPRRNYDKLRIGYASCNGFSHVKKERDTRDKYNRWNDLLARHDDKPLHMLLLGGDQVYGDPIWEQVEPIRKWAQRDDERKWSFDMGEQRARAVSRFYRELYEDRWNKAPVRRALAQIPSLMMWDDHDIFDGWGSHDESHTQSPVYQGIFAEASRHFRLFQLQNLGDQPGRQAICPSHNYSYGLKIGDMVILVLDMRSERTPQQVISRDAWDEIYDWLDSNIDTTVQHLVVMSSVPVVHLDFAALEKALALVPGKQNLEDDFRDHWLSRPHKQERLRLIHRLFEYARTKRCRVSILSGDVHVAGMGVLEDRRRKDDSREATTITQLISSPIVHPTPPQMVLYAYDTLNFFDSEQEVDQGIYSRMMQLPASDHRFLGGRNWLGLEVESSEDNKGRIWANWYVEDETQTRDDSPYTAVLHKID